MANDDAEEANDAVPLKELSMLELDAILKDESDPRYAEAKALADELLRPLNELRDTVGKVRGFQQLKWLHPSGVETMKALHGSWEEAVAPTSNALKAIADSMAERVLSARKLSWADELDRQVMPAKLSWVDELNRQVMPANVRADYVPSADLRVELDDELYKPSTAIDFDAPEVPDVTVAEVQIETRDALLQANKALGSIDSVAQHFRAEAIEEVKLRKRDRIINRWTLALAAVAAVVAIIGVILDRIPPS